MERTKLFVGVLVAVVAIGGAAGGAVYLGLLPGTGSSAPQGTPPEATEDAPSSNATFAFTIDNVSNCGQTCRLLNSTVRNELDRAAENVTLHIQIFTEDEGVWEGTTQVGDLESSESATSTTRIEVSPRNGLAIQQNDGNVTIVTDVRATNASQQFTHEDNVS